MLGLPQRPMVQGKEEKALLSRNLSGSCLLNRHRKPCSPRLGLLATIAGLSSQPSPHYGPMLISMWEETDTGLTTL